MTRRPIQPLDPEGAKAFSALPRPIQTILTSLRSRTLETLMQPKREEVRPLTKKEREALKAFGTNLEQKE